MNKSLYQGIYKLVDQDGNVNGVSVYDGRNQTVISLELYIERDAKPDIEDLPTEDQYNSK